MRLDQIRFDKNGLIPAIIQHAETKQVLTLAYMNQEALELTIKHRQTWLYSRSRQSLWHKGETSGHVQDVVSIHHDCDQDAILLQVIPRGPACHTGAESCFPTSRFDSDPLRELEQVIADRERQRPEGAYTTYLFRQGMDKILKKVGEESAEVIIAAKNGSSEELRMETADLLYHLMVLLRQADLPIAEVLAELVKRRTQK